MYRLLKKMGGGGVSREKEEEEEETKKGKGREKWSEVGRERERET